MCSGTGTSTFLPRLVSLSVSSDACFVKTTNIQYRKDLVSIEIKAARTPIGIIEDISSFVDTQKRKSVNVASPGSQATV